MTGLLTGLALQWFCNAYDYQLLVSGKPFFSLPANIPIIFECTVLFSALTAVFGMLGLNRLPLLYSPLFKSARFSRVTNDKFFIWIDEMRFKFRRSEDGGIPEIRSARPPWNVLRTDSLKD